MKKLFLNLLLLLVAYALARLLFPFGAIFTLYEAARRRSMDKVIGYLSNSARVNALSIDIRGNVVCRDLLNRTMIVENGYRFGDPRETISSVLGKNKATGTLSKTGIWLADRLNRLDENHVENAAQAPTYYAY